mmetsp:Transcript_23336/g.51041  ORF Transcript_23336/g.51041 Transcript_23336/m.51041 type:complete len:314 (+) Transcript_23336:987-1928(+)
MNCQWVVVVVVVVVFPLPQRQPLPQRKPAASSIAAKQPQSSGGGGEPLALVFVVVTVTVVGCGTGRTRQAQGGRDSPKEGRRDRRGGPGPAHRGIARAQGAARRRQGGGAPREHCRQGGRDSPHEGRRDRQGGPGPAHRGIAGAQGAAPRGTNHEHEHEHGRTKHRSEAEPAEAKTNAKTNRPQEKGGRGGTTRVGIRDQSESSGQGGSHAGSGRRAIRIHVRRYHLGGTIGGGLRGQAGARRGRRGIRRERRGTHHDAPGLWKTRIFLATRRVRNHPVAIRQETIGGGFQGHQKLDGWRRYHRCARFRETNR